MNSNSDLVIEIESISYYVPSNPFLCRIDDYIVHIQHVFRPGTQTDVQGSRGFSCGIFDMKSLRHVHRVLCEVAAVDAKGGSTWNL